MMLPDDIMGAPFVRGGRDGDGIDCLGVVLVVLELLGVPPELRPDPWRELQQAWRCGTEAAALSTGFPSGWELLPDVPAVAMDGDVALQHVGEYGVGVVAGAAYWTAVPYVGPTRKPWDRARPNVVEVWRISEGRQQ